MSVRAGAPDPQRADPADVRSMFDGIARFYDLLNTVLSAGSDRRWRRAAARAAALRPGDVALDVCTGTGRLAHELRRLVGPSGRVVGIDFSTGMLAVARRHVGGVEFRQGDATVLAGIDDAGVDAVTVAFGLRNIPDRRAALRAAHRVLRPGGRLVILEFGHVRLAGVGRLYTWYLTRVLPRLGRALNPRSGAYAYLPASIGFYPDERAVSGWLREEGFDSVSVRRLTLGVVTLHVATRGGQG
jgi:demethylmenaquinone methyltransferase/2-methoxy-6-polyprenyl-1,4-benzoquinol methylase